jgi:hypothetical protein
MENRDMSTDDTKDKMTATLETSDEGTAAVPAKAVSPRKLEANRKNAQRSTGPKTPEGKTKSAQNAVTHGIFVKQYLSGGPRETVDDIKTLAAGFWEHYQPVGMIEEMLVEKLCIETVRYSRVLRLEIDELARKHAFFGPGVDRVGRYGANVNRALYRVMEELERLQAARKASEKFAAAPDQELADLTAETEDEIPPQETSSSAQITDNEQEPSAL